MPNVDERIAQAIYGSADHPLKFGNIEIPCYVLEDGRRVLHQTGLVRSIGMARGGTRGKGDRLYQFVTGKGLEPFIPKHLSEASANPIKFRTPKGILAYGYEATVLADICEAVLAARKDGALQKQQLHIAEKCEILVRGFARVGIIALVDEATGYQDARAKDALYKILEAYIAEELRPYQRKFPNEFYKEMFRLLKWPYNPLSVKKPKYVGKLTNRLIYEKLPPGVLDELKSRNPKNQKGNRRHKHHQFLTEDIGEPHLEKQLAVVTTLMKISPNWRKFESSFQKAFPVPGSQTELDLDEEEDD